MHKAATHRKGAGTATPNAELSHAVRQMLGYTRNKSSLGVRCNGMSFVRKLGYRIQTSTSISNQISPSTPRTAVSPRMLIGGTTDTADEVPYFLQVLEVPWRDCRARQVMLLSRKDQVSTADHRTAHSKTVARISRRSRLVPLHGFRDRGSQNRPIK